MHRWLVSVPWMAHAQRRTVTPPRRRRVGNWDCEKHRRNMLGTRCVVRGARDLGVCAQDCCAESACMLFVDGVGTRLRCAGAAYKRLDIGTRLLVLLAASALLLMQRFCPEVGAGKKHHI
jgi:hypothetical protein